MRNVGYSYRAIKASYKDKLSKWVEGQLALPPSPFYTPQINTVYLGVESDGSISVSEYGSSTGTIGVAATVVEGYKGKVICTDDEVYGILVGWDTYCRGVNTVNNALRNLHDCTVRQALCLWPNLDQVVKLRYKPVTVCKITYAQHIQTRPSFIGLKEDIERAREVLPSMKMFESVFCD